MPSAPSIIARLLGGSKKPAPAMPPAHDPRIIAPPPAPIAALAKLSEAHELSASSVKYPRAINSDHMHLRATRNGRLIASAYNSITILYSIVRVIAAAAAETPLRLYKDNGDIIEEHPIQRLIQSPRPGNSTLWRDLLIDYLLYGCYFAEAATAASEIAARYGIHHPDPIRDLWRISPVNVSFASSRQTALPTKIIVGGTQEFAIDEKGKSLIFYALDYSPLGNDNHNQTAPADVAATAAEAFRAMQEHQRDQAKNRFQPTGIFITDEKDGSRMSDEQLADLQNNLKNWWALHRQTQTPPVTRHLTYQQLANNERDVDFIAGKNSLARDICSIYNLPPQIVGIQDSQSYRNMAEARQAFYLYSVLPVARQFWGRFAQWARLHYHGKNADLNIEPDENEIPALNERRAQAMTNANAIEFLTPNEKRKMFGLAPIEGGDVLIMRGGMPLADITNPPPPPENDEPPAASDPNDPENDGDSQDNDPPPDGK